MLPTFIIGLREGLEASLIVGIIAAFLIQRGERRSLRPMWYGVALAIGLCLAVAVILEVVNRSLPHKQQEGLETILALLAVAGVTYMVVWMKRHSRELKGSLEASAEEALILGSSWALVGMAFFAVLREGLETAVFLLAVFGSSKDPLATGTGAALGIAVAVGLGFAIYKGASGRTCPASSGSRASCWCSWPPGSSRARSTRRTKPAGSTSCRRRRSTSRWLVAPGSVRAALLTGMLGLQPVPTVGETLAWLLYAVPMGLYVLGRPVAPCRPSGRRPSRSRSPRDGVPPRAARRVRHRARGRPHLMRWFRVGRRSDGRRDRDVEGLLVDRRRPARSPRSITFGIDNDGPSVHEFVVSCAPTTRPTRCRWRTD